MIFTKGVWQSMGLIIGKNGQSLGFFSMNYFFQISSPVFVGSSAMRVKKTSRKNILSHEGKENMSGTNGECFFVVKGI